MDLAPIVLFVFNRPLHTRETLEALMANDLAADSTLIIYADGPKDNISPEGLEKIKATRELIREKQWCKQVEIVESDVNRGLANSIVKGVTEVVNRFGKIIVLEDDLITSKGFLKYMNEALNMYQNDEKVMHISGYMYPAKFETDKDTFFLNVLSCWGWATWKRAWQHLSLDVDWMMNQLDTKEKIRKFNIDGNADYYFQLRSNKLGNMHTWAVKWYASWLFKGGYSLFPHQTLVQNIGFDGSGDNCGVNMAFSGDAVDHINLKRIELAEDQSIRKALNTYYQGVFKPVSLKNSVKQFVKYKVYLKLRGLIKATK